MSDDDKTMALSIPTARLRLNLESTEAVLARIGEVMDPEDGLVWRWELGPTA